MAQIHVEYMPIDHPLFLPPAEPRRCVCAPRTVIWLRLVDVESALEGRSLRKQRALVLEVADSFCPWNEGCYRIEEGEISRAGGEADLRLDRARAGEPSSSGGFSFAQPGRCRSGRELPGGIACADRSYSSPAPWCPEMF